MCGIDAQHGTKPRHMPDPHRPAVDEVDDLRRFAEAELIGCQHPVAPSEGGDVALPAEFGAGTELAAVQQHQRVAVTGLEKARDETVDNNGAAMDLNHLIAIGLTGEPTAPTNLSGGAMSWNS